MLAMRRAFALAFVFVVAATADGEILFAEDIQGHFWDNLAADAVLEKATEAKKPVMVLVSPPECSDACKDMVNSINDGRQVRDVLGSFVINYVNGEDDRAMWQLELDASELEVWQPGESHLPQAMFFNAEGTPLVLYGTTAKFKYFFENDKELAEVMSKALSASGQLDSGNCGGLDGTCSIHGSSKLGLTAPSGSRCQSKCAALHVNDWLEAGDQLIVGSLSDSIFATVTSEGDVLVLDPESEAGSSSIIWQALASSEQRLASDVVTRDNKAVARLTLLSESLVATVGNHVVWKQSHSAAGCEDANLQLADTGELLLTCRGVAQPVWRSGAVMEQKAYEPHAVEPGPNCRQFLTCDACIDDWDGVSHGCGWCLSRRLCVPDEPGWCDSPSDHVSPKCEYEEQTCKCPSREELEADVLRRREAKAAALLERQRFAEEAALESEASEAGSGGNDRKFVKMLERRAVWAEEGRGAIMPYEVLGVAHGATPSEIRRAYRQLSLALHPDKNPKHKNLADQAFADLGIAYALIGNPDKRANFDENGGTGFEESWQKQNWRGDEDFFFGSALVATLTLKLWEKRLVGDSIWLVDLYAAWCPHCRTFAPSMEKAAKLLDEADAGVEVGGVNCVKEKTICFEYVGVKEYPTLVLLNRESGMLQRFPKNTDFRDPKVIVEWVQSIATEWRFLLSQSNVIMTNASAFQEILNTTDMVLTLFTDGVECMPCKTARTNLMRLSASLASFPLRVAVVDCEQPENTELCYTDHGVPQPPHRPVLKAWPRLAKLGGPRGSGEQLYDVSVLESHIALELLERALRLSLAPEAREDAEGQRGDYHVEKDEEKDEQADPGAGGGGPSQARPFDGPKISWTARPSLQWEGPDHQAKPIPVEGWHGPRFQHEQIG